VHECGNLLNKNETRTNYIYVIKAAPKSYEQSTTRTDYLGERTARSTVIQVQLAQSIDSFCSARLGQKQNLFPKSPPITTVCVLLFFCRKVKSNKKHNAHTRVCKTTEAKKKSRRQLTKRATNKCKPNLRLEKGNRTNRQIISGA